MEKKFNKKTIKTTCVLLVFPCSFRAVLKQVQRVLISLTKQMKRRSEEGSETKPRWDRFESQIKDQILGVLNFSFETAAFYATKTQVTHRRGK